MLGLYLAIFGVFLTLGFPMGGPMGSLSRKTCRVAIKPKDARHFLKGIDALPWYIHRCQSKDTVSPPMPRSAHCLSVVPYVNSWYMYMYMYI